MSPTGSPGTGVVLPDDPPGVTLVSAQPDQVVLADEAGGGQHIRDKPLRC